MSEETDYSCYELQTGAILGESGMVEDRMSQGKRVPEAMTIMTLNFKKNILTFEWKEPEVIDREPVTRMNMMVCDWQRSGLLTLL